MKLSERYIVFRIAMWESPCHRAEVVKVADWEGYDFYHCMACGRAIEPQHLRRRSLVP